MSDPLSADTSKPVVQFQLSSVFVMTLIASLVAGYLSSRGEHLVPVGLITTSVTGAVALVIGIIWPPLTNRLFWAMVITAMMQAVSADVILLSEHSVYGWPITAGLGAIAAAGSTSIYPRMIKAALTTGITMSVFVLMIDAPIAAKIANIITATIGGALLGAIIETLGWVEQKRWVTQPIIGLMLVVSAIAFSTIAPQLIPGW